MSSNIYSVKDTEKYLSYHKVYNQRWKKDDQNQIPKYKTDNDIFNTKQNSQVLISDKNYFKILAKEIAEKNIDQKLRVRKFRLKYIRLFLLTLEE